MQITFLDGPIEGMVIDIVSDEVIKRKKIVIYNDRPFLKCLYRLNDDMTANFIEHIKTYSKNPWPNFPHTKS